MLAALCSSSLIRWPFLVPYLARIDADPSQPARREPLTSSSRAFNRYLGVAVGEHLGYLLTGAWTILVGAAFTQTALLPRGWGFPGSSSAPCWPCAPEFVGPAERHGWKLAATLTPITYIAWSLWLVAAGIALLL